MTRKIAHWEVAVALFGAVLGTWLVRPALGWAVAAALLAIVVGVLAWPARRRWIRIALPMLALTGAAVALRTSWEVRTVERAWPERREALIRSASQQLDETLGAAVDLARQLADAAAAAAELSRQEAFSLLERAVKRAGPEGGALVLDHEDRAWAWAGRHRVDPGDGPAELSARITAFYVVLEARRQAGRLAGVGQVVLAADSAVPDRKRTVAERFARQTGAGLEFYTPGTAPATSDVFDYYIPGGAEEAQSRGPESTVTDTLFSVRTVPPSQGPFKLQVLASGSRNVAVVLSATLALLVVAGGPIGRWTGVLVSGVLLLVTPVGPLLGLGGLFSSATYFRAVLGPVTASAGGLLVTSAVVAMAVVPFLDRGLRLGRLVGPVLAGVLLLGAPYVMGFLAGGITPPGDDISVWLWLGWEATLTVASVLMLLMVALVVRGTGARPAPPWTSWAAMLFAGGTALLGLFVWDPLAGWPSWYPVLWVPALLLAVLPAPRTRSLSAIAVTAGAAAAVLTWSAVVQGRLVLAERDVTRLSGGDPVAIGMLERFAASLQAAAAPRSAAALYGAWRRSPLSEDDYPVVMASWAPDGRPLARLDLAELDLRAALFQVVAADARGGNRPIMEQVVHTPGILYLVAVPFVDSSVVTIAVGPRSRLIEPVRLARFLRGERRSDAPYELELGEPQAAPGPGTGVAWRRDGWTIRGNRTLELTGGPRHLHAAIAVDGLGHHAVRGVLVVFVDVLLIGLLWFGGTLLGGGLEIPSEVRELLRFRSYRVRLTIALAGFFILPTLVFSVWTVARLREDTAGSIDLVVQQTLSDAASTARRFEGLPAAALRGQLADLAEDLNADLLWYDGGTLLQASPAVLLELGLLDRYMPSTVFRSLILRDRVDVAEEVSVGGQPTRVGYRSVGSSRPDLVLATPRLVDVRNLLRDQEDVLYGMALTALLGLMAAAGLAAMAARSLAMPVQSLRGAAMAVGRGVALPAFDPATPTEFVPVVRAFERMARDVEASQSALEAARRRTVSVLQNVATGVVAVDRTLRVTLANPRAEELLGVALSSGTPLAASGSSEWQPVWAWVREFIGTGVDTDAHEFSVDDRRVRVQAAAVHGDPGGAVVALDDTTELTRAVRVLAWGELAHQVAHEIKNPLTPIRLGIQHLQRVRRDPRADFDAAFKRTARNILAEIERLDAIARAFARFGAPPAEAAPLEPADVVEIARDTADLYSLGEGPAVAVEAVGRVVALVRRDEVKEVLVNLIENARDAGAANVRISVLNDRDAPPTLVLSDDGRGIPTSDLPHVLEPRFSTTTSGTGLGLAICKRLVESWNGSISVESELGHGTVVRVTLGGGPAPSGGDEI